MLFFRIPFVTVGVCIADDIEPVPSPTLTKLRTSEQVIYLSFVSIRGIIRHERVNVLRERRQSNQVLIEPAEDDAFFGRWSWRKTVSGKFLGDESVDWIRMRDGRCS